MEKILARKKLLTTLVIGVLALTLMSTTTSPLKPASAHECPPDAVSCFVEGRMTGGGRIDTDEIRWPPVPGIIVTHGFELHCNASELPNGLQINWNDIDDSSSSRFHLETLGDVLCWDDPKISPKPPNAPFDTMSAHGYGRYNGQPGAFVYIVFTDAGEPGRNDEATIVVYDSAGVLQLDLTGKLEFGNHQAHKGTGNTQSSPPPTSTSAVLSVNSADMQGTPIEGLWVEVWQNGALIQEGYSPLSASIQTGTQYQVYIGNWENVVFDHWDDGSTNPTRTITPTQDTTVTGFFMT